MTSEGGGKRRKGQGHFERDADLSVLEEPDDDYDNDDIDDEEDAGIEDDADGGGGGATGPVSHSGIRRSRGRRSGSGMGGGGGGGAVMQSLTLRNGCLHDPHGVLSAALLRLPFFSAPFDSVCLCVASADIAPRLHLAAFNASLVGMLPLTKASRREDPYVREGGGEGAVEGSAMGKGPGEGEGAGKGAIDGRGDGGGSGVDSTAFGRIFEFTLPSTTSPLVNPAPSSCALVDPTPLHRGDGDEEKAGAGEVYRLDCAVGRPLLPCTGLAIVRAVDLRHQALLLITGPEDGASPSPSPIPCSGFALDPGWTKERATAGVFDEGKGREEVEKVVLVRGGLQIPPLLMGGPGLPCHAYLSSEVRGEGSGAMKARQNVKRHVLGLTS